jgi:outer membrane biosynthesis protein TonB
MFRWVSCLLVGVVVLHTALPTHAQRSSGRRPAPVKRTGRVKAVKPAPKVAAPPAPVVSNGPLLPRFWALADSAERIESAAVFSQYLSHFVQYPSTALQAGVRGTIHVLLSVLPDGRVERIAVTRRDLDSPSEGAVAPNEMATAKAVQQLDAELQRVVWQLRFKPATMRTDSTTAQADTVTISHRFTPQ